MYMDVLKVKLDTSSIKLDQLLKWSQIAETGGHAKNIIKSGVIKVNGSPVNQRGKTIYKGDVIEINEQIKLIVE